MELPKLPSLPTDNLYKFMALSGLVALLLIPGCWLLLHVRILPLRKAQTVANNAQVYFRNLHEDYTVGRQKTFRQAFDLSIRGAALATNEQMQELLDNPFQIARGALLATNPQQMEVFGFISNSFLVAWTQVTNSVRLINLKNSIETARIELTNSFTIQNLEEAKLDTAARFYADHAVGITIFVAGFTVVSLFLMCQGFWFWYVRVQIPLDEKLRAAIKEQEQSPQIEKEMD